MLHTDAEFEYYKVPAVNGTLMTSCNVVDICKAVDMKAVCDGPYYKPSEGRNNYCMGTHPDDCYVTPFSGDGNPEGSGRECSVGLKGLPGCGGIRITENLGSLKVSLGKVKKKWGNFHTFADAPPKNKYTASPKMQKNIV